MYAIIKVDNRVTAICFRLYYTDNSLMGIKVRIYPLDILRINDDTYPNPLF